MVVVVVVAAACLRTATESYSLKSLPYCNKTRFNINLSMLYDTHVLCQSFPRSESPKQTLRGSDNSWTPKCSRLWLIDFSLLSYSLTHSVEQSSSWEANWFSASQEIPCILWNPEINYGIHKCPPPVPILSQLDPVHAPTSHFLKIHLNIILPSMPGSSK